MKKRGPLKIIVDSNFLFLPAQFSIDIFEAIEELLSKRVKLVIPSPVFEEIARVAGRTRGPERIALELAKKCDIEPVERLPGETVDDLVLRLAREWRCPVATNDARLRRRLRSLGLPVIFLRGLGKLELDGEV